MKILLFDDHRIFGESLSKLLEDWDAISICHYVMSADQPKKHCDTRQSRQSVL